jgi:DNA-binding transcriptional LysR family regulator
VRIDDLKLFRNIALQRSLTRAAEQSGITQSAASQNIRDLERDLQVTLLDRTCRPLRVTPAGKSYLDFCQAVLREREVLEAKLSAFREEAAAGVVRFATIYSVGLSEVHSLEEDFRKRYPGGQLAIDYLRPEKVYEAVLLDRADLGVVSYPRPPKELHSTIWRQEEMVVTMAPSHRLAALPSLHVSSLQGEAFVAFDEDLPVQQHINRFLREEKVTVNKVIHLDNLDSIREAVAQGTGLAIVPKPVLKPYLEQGRLVAAPLVPRFPRRPLGIVYRRRKRFSKAAAAFLELLLERGLPPQART